MSTDSDSDRYPDVRPDAKARLPWKKLLFGFAAFVLVLIAVAFQDEKPPSFPAFEGLRAEVDPAINPVPELKLIAGAPVPDEIRLMQDGSAAWEDVPVDAFLASQRPSLDAWTEGLASGGTWQLEEVTDFNQAFDYLSDWQSLMRVKKLEAEQFARRGEKGKSLALGMELLETAHHLESADGAMIVQLVAVTFHQMGLAAVESSMSSAGDMSDTQWLAVQARLQATEPDPEQFAECFGYEYLFMSNTLDALKEGRISPRRFNEEGRTGVSQVNRAFADRRDAGPPLHSSVGHKTMACWKWMLHLCRTSGCLRRSFTA